ncbi:hypothetical protein MIMGU_mgv1a023596mg [Erythranthe guttata]|uniref:LRAT domain-containing protein n=1 Tax=Erythranthe guttata TaxID=4155 RepID=A0A022R0Q1_ERYGU|nr:hypothetical protein MIMGU_mgv1a023596mg [Erythranthe guttata]
MGLISHRVKRSDLKIGDHIYTWRNLFIYTHHGIYVGDNKVVHFTLDQGSSFSSSSVSTVPIACLNFPDSCCSTSGVIISCLNCFLQNGSLHRFEYGVSFLAYSAKIRGGCTAAKSDSMDVVFYRAMYLLWNGLFGDYDLFSNNCEDFALYCKTGLLVLAGTDSSSGGSSGQVMSAVAGPTSVILSLPLRIFFSNPIVLTAATTFYLSRYVCDIGVCDDAIKVKVEDLASIRGNQTSARRL